MPPANVVSYRRTTISQAETNQGYYFGMEHEKRLDTPIDWTWERAGGAQGQPIWKMP